MSLSSLEKQKIRIFLGFSPYFKNANSSLESAFDNIVNFPDAENLIKSYILQLEDIDNKLMISATAAIASDAENVKINAINSTNLLEKLGRSYIKRIANTLGFMEILSDYYSKAPIANEINSRNSTELHGYK